MNRNQKRHPELYNNSCSSELTQNNLVEELAMEKANIFIANTAKIINDCYFNAMRSHGIGEVRANKILAETEELIKLEAERGK